MFIGEYEHSIDEKSRVIIPIKFREALKGEFYLTRGLHDECLYIYPEDEWKLLAEKLRNLPWTKGSVQNFIRLITSGATECKLDRQGRIFLPQNLRDYAKIKTKVVLVGVMERIEVWSSEKWNDLLNNNTLQDLSQKISEEYGF